MSSRTKLVLAFVGALSLLGAGCTASSNVETNNGGTVPSVKVDGSAGAGGSGSGY